MIFDIITLFPKIVEAYCNESIVKRAREKKLITVRIHNLRDFANDLHRKVDDRSYSGGPGMVLKAEPLMRAIRSLKIKPGSRRKKIKIILFSAAGKQLDDRDTIRFSKGENLILIAGRYEGIDARMNKMLKDEG